MRILFITIQFNPPRSTGAGNSSSLIYKELNKRGHEVDLLIFDRESLADDYKKTQYGESFRKNDFNTIYSELSNIKDGEYDIIHQYSGGHNKYILPFVARKFNRTKIVTTINMTWHFCWYHQDYHKNDENCCKFPKNFRCTLKKRDNIKKGLSPIEYFIRKLQNKLIKKYDKVFVLSKGIKKLLDKSSHEISNIISTPNFYDPDLFEKVKNFQYDLEEDKTVILYAGRMLAVKGVTDLLPAFKKLRGEDIELRIMGGGGKKSKLKKEYQSSERIKFIDHVPYKSKEFIKNYIEADIFFAGSRSVPKFWMPHGFGRTFLEAALTQNAIIAGYFREIPKILEDKVEFYRIYDIDDLANKLRALINNPNKRNQLAENIHDHVIEEFNVEKTIDKIEREYNKLLED